jgi:arsenite-transporting ATPase
MDNIKNVRDAAPQRPVLIVGGKDGAGKTTCSAAIALRFADSGMRTIIITSDLSPSLSHIFERTIGDAIAAVAGNLDAYEISQDAIITRWKELFGPGFHGILEYLIDVKSLESKSRHTILDYIGSAPSLREETMLDLIRKIAESGKYDRLVWDRAPTEETLDLIGLPAIVKNHLHTGVKVFEGLDRFGRRLIGKQSLGSIMDDWIEISARLARFFHDQSTFLIAADPETPAVDEVRKLIDTFAYYHLPVHGLIINRVLEHSETAALTVIQERQQRQIEELKEMAGERYVAILPFSPAEIRGIKRLQKIGEALVAGLAL